LIVYAAIMPFGKYRGLDVEDVPTPYLRWCLREVNLDGGLHRAVEAELSRRGDRFVDAAAVLGDLEEEVTRRVSEDGQIGHDDAGRLADHVLEAFEAVRQRHGIGTATQMVIPGERPTPTALVG
jgi:uncharacterized protein (DUF3820 family)